jgi:hypothetical protein
MAVTNTNTLTGTNDVNFMVADQDFVYSATDEAIVKTSRVNSADSTTMMLQQLISDAATVGLRTEDFSFQNDVAEEPTAMAQDAENVYITLGVGSGKYKCLKIGKTTARIDGHYEYTGAQDIPYSLATDGTYVYSGMNTFPGEIVKLAATTMTLVGSPLVLNTEENDIRLLVHSAGSDPDHLYAFTHTSPSVMAKVDLTTFTQSGSVSLLPGEDDVLAATIDSVGDNIYAACFTTPGKIVKLNRVSMTRTLAATFPSNANPDAIVSDHNDIFAGFYQTPGHVLRLSKEDLSVEDTLALSEGQDKVTTLFATGSQMYAGLATTPAKVLELSGYEAPVDCIVGSWSNWGECSSSCSGGSELRSRTILTQAEHGSAACPETEQTQACNAHVVCPEDCGGGKMWVVDGQTPDRTCINANPVVAETGVARCQCPPDRPMLHTETSMCVATDACDKNATKCEDIECNFIEGRVQINLIDGRQPDHLKGFICHHTEGRLGGCQCLCYNNHLEHLWESMSGTIDCKKDVYGENDCLIGGPLCETNADFPGECSWAKADAQANCEHWLDCKGIVCQDGSSHCQARSEYASSAFVNASITSYVLVARTIAPEHSFSQAPFVTGDSIKVNTKAGGVLSNAVAGLVEVVPAANAGAAAAADVEMSTVVYQGDASFAGTINFMHTTNNVNSCMTVSNGQITRTEGAWCGATDTENLAAGESGLWKVVAVDGRYFQLRQHVSADGTDMCLTVDGGGVALTVGQCINSDAQQYYFSWL